MIRTPEKLLTLLNKATLEIEEVEEGKLLTFKAGYMTSELMDALRELENLTVHEYINLMLRELKTLDLLKFALILKNFITKDDNNNSLMPSVEVIVTKAAFILLKKTLTLPCFIEEDLEKGVSYTVVMEKAFGYPILDEDEFKEIHENCHQIIDFLEEQEDDPAVNVTGNINLN